jgi:hypothetical protein
VLNDSQLVSVIFFSDGIEVYVKKGSNWVDRVEGDGEIGAYQFNIEIHDKNNAYQYYYGYKL